MAACPRQQRQQSKASKPRPTVRNTKIQNREHAAATLARMRMQPPPLTHFVKPFWHHNLATFENQPDAMANHPLPLCIMHALCGGPGPPPVPCIPAPVPACRINPAY